MNKKNVFFMLLASLIVLSCSKAPKDSDNDNNNSIKFSQSPIDLQGIDAKFAKNIAYDNKERTVFDIWLPNSNSPTALLIYIHGGSFTQGDKSMVYKNNNTWTFPEDIRTLLRKKIAVATINYTFLKLSGEQDGLLKPLNDCKRALQYIRSRATDFNINKKNIVLSGNSAGAGSSLWIGTQNDMAETNNEDLVLRESTRVKGIAVRETQATYNFERWTTDVFPEYGITFSQLVSSSSMFKAQIAMYYGISNFKQYNTPEIEQYRKNVDMLAFLSSDDPEIYVNNTRGMADNPFTNNGDLVHHPYHVRTIKKLATQAGVKVVAYYNDNPTPYSDPSNETWLEFIIRKANE